MKQIKLTLLIGAVLAALACITPARAGEYAVQQTFWSVTDFTNNPAVATNLSTAVECKAFDCFSLHVMGALTNASTGSLAIRWSTSLDGVNFATGGAAGTCAGWFAVPLTNSGTSFYWSTNIDMQAVGHWRLDWLTNGAVQHMTNIQIKAYVKPIVRRIY